MSYSELVVSMKHVAFSRCGSGSGSGGGGGVAMERW